MPSDLALVAAMYPPDGLDWAALMADPTTGRRYREAAERRIAEDFEMLPVQPQGASRTVISGFEAYLTGMRAVMEAFSSFRICAQSFIAIDGGVLVVTTLDGETIGEPRRFSGEGGAIFELKNGLIARVREFDNRAELYAAGGISEEEARRRAVPARELIGPAP